jgi:hypothetical protein
VDEAWVGIAGVAGTLVGTLGASWFGFRQARVQVAEARAEAERQRRFESLTERRGPRQTAYADFIVTCREAYDLLNAVNHADDDQFPHGQYRTVLSKLRTREASVAVMGPEDAASKANDTLVAVMTAKNYLVNGRPRAEQLAKVDLVRQAISHFTVAARSALEDHGEPPPTTSAAVPRS